ncbi:P-selectin glycoprotein ligand 1-like [Heptranchias perlo]|uniref:P-selectin glycoprotein ligand 1-like n=1 Tax=Heptranchias perlo TaxID=212740 RepID=UPI0035599C8A
MQLMWCSLPVLLAVVAGVVVMGQSSTETLEISDLTEPISVGVTQSPSDDSESTTESSAILSTLSLTSTSLTDETGSPVQPASTTATPTAITSVYSATGYLSNTTQDFSASQQVSTDLIELVTSPGFEAETVVSQASSSTNGSELWADELGNATGMPEVTSASTAVTNTSEIGGLLVHPDVKAKTQSPPTSKMTSTKKHTTGFRPATTAVPSTTAITKRKESIPLKPTISFVSKITKAATRSYNRLSTAQATTKKIGLVTQCLIAIAILAGVCTIFVICTIVLCTKLSSQTQGYRVNRTNGTELMCISALLPEEERKLRKKMKPKRLRDFKMTTVGQTSESDDDDLTLHSFVTEH